MRYLDDFQCTDAIASAGGTTIKSFETVLRGTFPVATYPNPIGAVCIDKAANGAMTVCITKDMSDSSKWYISSTTGGSNLKVRVYYI